MRLKLSLFSLASLLLIGGCASAGTATLSWINPTANTDGSALVLASINVYRAASATGPWTKIGSTTAAGTPPAVPATYTDTTAPDGVTVYYAVTAVGEDGMESVQSTIVSKAMPAPIPNPPTNLIVK